jgi:catechol 2,3-dioxygenase-like lactoylglutathione lyase family enzyme
LRSENFAIGRRISFLFYRELFDTLVIMHTRGAAESGFEETVVDLVPFLLVTDVERSIAFYEALGFAVIKRYDPNGRLEFAGLEATSAAKLMLARVERVPARDRGHSNASGPGWLYLYTPDLEALRERLRSAGIETGKIEDGPGPGPNRQLCVRDPDGHGHMIAELWPGSVAGGP